MREITLAEVAEHNDEDDCWIVVDGKVYDITKYLKFHPGGEAPVAWAGKPDASEVFSIFHDASVLAKRGEKYLVGRVAEADLARERARERERRSARARAAAEREDEDYDAGLSPSAEASFGSGGTAHLLPAERARASFDTELLTNFIDGGVEATAKRRWILASTARSASDLEHKCHWTREEAMARHLRDFIGVHTAFTSQGYAPVRREIVWMSANSANSGSLMPHFALFLPTLASQGTAEQIGWWVPLALQFKIVGAYAQTELAHGSNVRGLQTTAEYDPNTEEFVLDTPTLGAMKWWNSGLGLVATHAAVYAQLIVPLPERRCVGVHVFMVQLRDEEHACLPGIELGDVGPKLGDNSIDTGYARFRGVRVPREHMLARRQYVTRAGAYVRAPPSGPAVGPRARPRPRQDALRDDAAGAGRHGGDRGRQAGAGGDDRDAVQLRAAAGLRSGRGARAGPTRPRRPSNMKASRSCPSSTTRCSGSVSCGRARRRSRSTLRGGG